MQEVYNKNTLEYNHKIQKGIIENSNLHNMIYTLEEEYRKITEDFELTYQDPAIPDASIEEFIEFVPDDYEIIEIIKEIYVSTPIQDETSYYYRDKQNGYSIDFIIKYDSGIGSFEIIPQKLLFEAKKEYDWKRSSVGVMYLSNNSGGLVISYDVFRFLSAGGFIGFVETEPVVGVVIGYRF
jgi:hypothetical protein